MTDTIGPEQLGRAGSVDADELRKLYRQMTETGVPRRYKRSNKNPRPQQTTAYRVAKVAETTDLLEVRMHEDRLGRQNNVWTSSEYWTRNYEVR